MSRGWVSGSLDARSLRVRADGARPESAAVALTRLLVANRGEVAVRIAAHRGRPRAAERSPCTPTTTAPAHARRADRAVRLPGAGRGGLPRRRGASSPPPIEAGCDLLHPGYGFLSENPTLARRLRRRRASPSSGPPPGTRSTCSATRSSPAALAGSAASRCCRGRRPAPTLPTRPGRPARLGEGGAVMVKAWPAAAAADCGRCATRRTLAEALQRCRLGGAAAFGDGTCSPRGCCTGARHIEVQVLGDGDGAVIALGDRDCSAAAAAAEAGRDRPRDRPAADAARPAAQRRRAQLGEVGWATRPGHRRVPGPRRRSRLPRGATRGCRWSTRSPRRSPAWTWCELQLRVAAGATPAPTWASPTAAAAAGLRRAGPGQRRDAATDGRCGRRRHAATRFDPPPGAACGSTPRRRGRRPRRARATTPCWPRSSCTTAGGDLADALPAPPPGRLAEFDVAGVATNTGPAGRALLARPRRRSPARVDHRSSSTQHLRRARAALAPQRAGRSAASRRRPACAACRAAVGHRGRASRPPGATGRRRRAGARARGDEDGARRRRAQRRRGARRLASRSGDVVAEGAAAGRRSSPTRTPTRLPTPATEPTWTPSGPIWPRCVERHAVRARRGAGRTRSRGATPPAAARRGRTSPTWRPGQLRRVRRAGHRRAATPPHARGAASRAPRPTAWSPASARSTPTRERRACVGAGLRLHGAGRHPGHAQPPQDRPAARARRAAAAAGGAVRRGRRRAARRHRPAGSSPASTSPTFTLFGAAVAAWCRWSASSSGRCFAGNAALLGCCDVIIATEGAQHRHGRPGDDRGRRARRRRAPRTIGPIDGAGAQRRGRRAGRRRRRPRCAAARAYLGLLPGRRVGELGRAPTSALLRHAGAGEPGARSTTCAPVLRRAGRHRLGAGAARRLRRRHDHRAGPDRGPAGRRDRQQPAAPGRRDRRRRRGQGRRASCSCATRTGCRSCRSCDTPGFMVGPEAERTGDGAALRPAVRRRRQADACRCCAVVLRKAYGLGAQAMTGGEPARARASPSPGRPASSAAMGLEGAVRLGYRRELEAMPRRGGAAGARSTAVVAAAYRAARRSTWPRCSRSTTSIDPADTRAVLVDALRAADGRP